IRAHLLGVSSSDRSLSGAAMNLRFAFRSLLRDPAFTAVAVLMIALGIGLNTAVFTVLDAVLLRPLPYHDPERIVSVLTYYEKQGTFGSVSAPDFRDWEQQSRSFDAMAMYQSGPESVVANQVAQRLALADVTGGFFRVMGVEPLFGRLFTPEELGNGGPFSAVIS